MRWAHSIAALTVLLVLWPIVSSQCASGWTHVADDGIEGVDSCIKLFSPGFNYTGAQAQCEASGAHLLTLRGKSKSASLMTSARALAATGSLIIGCYQLPSAVNKSTGWVWVDGTDASNLNCGTGGGGEGCNLWNTNAPK
jgi:hypothetical protein